ncbi:hypothetical protein Tco_0797006 [Tanacetum coccineum]
MSVLSRMCSFTMDIYGWCALQSVWKMNLSKTSLRHSEYYVDNDNTIDDDSTYGEDIEYVDASPPDVEIDSLEVVEIVDPEVGRIDDDILLTIKDDILREKLNVNLLIAKIDSLIIKLSTLINDHFKRKGVVGGTTTHVDFGSNMSRFIFDLSIDKFPPADRSDLIMRVLDKLTPHLVSPELECFNLRLRPNRRFEFYDPRDFDFPDCEDSHACSITQEFHILSFILEIQYPNLID